MVTLTFFVLNCLCVCLLYIRKKGKGKREESHDAIEPEIPVMKKWLVVVCDVLNDETV